MLALWDVPFYADRFRAVGLSAPVAVNTWEDLLRIPTVDKAAIIEDQRRAPPFGSMLPWPVPQLERIYRSAGPIYLGFTGKDVARAGRIFEGHWRTLGVRPGDVADISTTYHWVVGGTLLDEGLRALGATVIPGGPGQSEQRLNVLQDTGATVLQAFTPYAEALGMQLAASDIDPVSDLAVRLLVVGGEMRTATAKKRLEDLWGGARAREFYGAAEVGGMVAAECDIAGDGMHLSDRFIIEIVDPDNGKPRRMESGGEIIITELFKEAQPLLRYRTGDITEGIDARPCSCGRTSPRLRRIVGRTSSVLRIRGLFVQPAQVSQIAQASGFDAHRIVVKREGVQDEATLEIERPAHDDLRLDEFVERLKATTGLRWNVDVLPTESLDEPYGNVVDKRDFL